MRIKRWKTHLGRELGLQKVEVKAEHDALQLTPHQQDSQPLLTIRQQAQQTPPSNWANLGMELLSAVAKHLDSATDLELLRRYYSSTAFGYMSPVCTQWGTCIRTSMLSKVRKHLADELQVDEDTFVDSAHIEVTRAFFPDALARLRYFPKIQSINVKLDTPGEQAFRFYNGEQDGHHQLHNGLLLFEQKWLEAIFSLNAQLVCLHLSLPSGDRLCELPWENLAELRKLSLGLDRIVQGTFASVLPRVPSLTALYADIDFFSVPCLKFLPNLAILDLSLAEPEGGFLSVEQAQERDNEVLSYLAHVTTLESLVFSQQATTTGVACLASLPNLTSLVLRLPASSEVASDIWQVQKLFQKHTFRLKALHYEFKLDMQFATASLSSADAEDRSHSSAGLNMWQLPVAWSDKPIVVYAGVEAM